MAFWSNYFGTAQQPTAENPGDPHGLEVVGEPSTASRSFNLPIPSPWDGYPSDWGTAFEGIGTIGSGLNRLIDTAWACLDLNASVLSAMPVYLLSNGQLTKPKRWMINPDPMVYTGWPEFAKQVFWDFQLGEVFILAMGRMAGRPVSMRVIPPWMVNVDITGGGRVYSIGGHDVTEDMLHIRYQSTSADAHGHGPLEVAGARMTTAGLLQRYASRLAETGGVPQYWINVPKFINQTEADDLLEIWINSRVRNAGYPAVLSGGSSLEQMEIMNAKDLALLELAQFSESRVAVLLGVPPFLVGLPSGGDSMTYSNVSSLFDFHDRASLGPKAVHVMTALSNWATARPQSVELNRDEYSRPDYATRAEANVKYVDKQVLSSEEVRIRERFNGPAPGAVVGNDQATTSEYASGTFGEREDDDNE